MSVITVKAMKLTKGVVPKKKKKAHQIKAMKSGGIWFIKIIGCQCFIT